MTMHSKSLSVLVAMIAVLLPVEPAQAQQGLQADLQRAHALARAAYTMYQEDAPPDTVALGRAGVLLAEGDSWFDYPRVDVLKALRAEGYEVVSVAHYGQTLEQMAYDTVQLSGTIGAMKLLKKEGKRPKAILLSAGGNDLAGPELSALLTYHGAGEEPLDEPILREVIDVRLRQALRTWLLAVTEMSTNEFGQKIPILIHGYDYPVPDGRGFLGGLWILPGPWLDPSFRARAYSPAKSGVEANAGVMHAVIDRFNKMLTSIPNDPQLKHVRYVKVIGTLSAEPDRYKSDWSNELHPTRDGFRRVAKRFEETINGLP
jgi:lysophospholipase L1-like esterase